MKKDRHMRRIIGTSKRWRRQRTAIVNEVVRFIPYGAIVNGMAAAVEGIVTKRGITDSGAG